MLDFLLKFIVPLLGTLLSLLPSGLQERYFYVKEFRVIPNITTPQQVIWKNDDTILFVTEGDIWEYSISQNTSRVIATRESNEFVGVDFKKVGGKELLFCKIEHYTISSYDEYSTKFTVKDSEGDIKNELQFFQTIKPIYMDEEKIIAVTAMDFLQEHFYIININTGELREIEEPKKKRFKLHIPKEVEFKKAYIRNEDRYVVEDIFGNIYLYLERNSIDSASSCKGSIINSDSGINQSVETLAKKYP